MDVPPHERDRLEEIARLRADADPLVQAFVQALIGEGWPESAVRRAVRNAGGNDRVQVEGLLKRPGFVTEHDYLGAVEELCQLTGNSRRVVLTFLERQHGNKHAALDSLLQAQDAVREGWQPPQTSSGNRGTTNTERAAEEEVGPLTLEPIPRGQGCTIRGDPTGQRYTMHVLKDYLRSATPFNAVVPTTGVKMRTKPETKRREGESTEQWLNRILIPDSNTAGGAGGGSLEEWLRAH